MADTFEELPIPPLIQKLRDIPVVVTRTKYIHKGQCGGEVKARSSESYPIGRSWTCTKCGETYDPPAPKTRMKIVEIDLETGEPFFPSTLSE